MRRLLPIILLLLPLASCRTTHLAYISDAQRDSATAIMQTYSSVIMPGDLLYIYVASQTPESVIPFNQETRTYSTATDGVMFVDTTHRAQATSSEMNGETRYIKTDVTGYEVKNDGTIDFPLLGKYSVVGLTKDSLSHIIETQLKQHGYVNDPLVTIQLMNFRVTVVGEVRIPQQIHADGTRLTLLEALAICGDLTDYGKRENVTIVREVNGLQTYGQVDLTSRALFDSPYYYLQQNDIVYVEPTNLRKRTAVRDPNNPRYIAIAVSLAATVTSTMNAINAKRRLDFQSNR